MVVAVLLKRSAMVGMPEECGRGCCTPVHGRHTKHIRRQVKRADRLVWRREVVRIMHDCD